MRQPILATLCLLAASLAFADEPTVKATQVWARATAPGARHGGVFMQLKNDGRQADRLLKSSAAIARQTELHTHTLAGGVARMTEVKAIEIPAGTTTELKPGGLHVMLIELARPLDAGEQFPLTLDFEKAGRQTVTVTIRGFATGSGHDHSATGHHAK